MFIYEIFVECHKIRSLLGKRCRGVCHRTWFFFSSPRLTITWPFTTTFCFCFAPGELLLPMPGIVHCPCFWKTPSSIFYTISKQNWLWSRCHVWAWRCETQVVICEPGSRRGETGCPMFYPPSPPPPCAAGKTSATPNYLDPLLSCNCTGWVPNSTEWAPWQI